MSVEMALASLSYSCQCSAGLQHLLPRTLVNCPNHSPTELQAKHQHPSALLITYFLLQLLPYSYQGNACQGLHACPRDLTMTLHLKYFCGIE